MRDLAELDDAVVLLVDTGPPGWRLLYVSASWEPVVGVARTEVVGATLNEVSCWGCMIGVGNVGRAGGGEVGCTSGRRGAGRRGGVDGGGGGHPKRGELLGVCVNGVGGRVGGGR